jgi:hypothetical protein
MRRKDAERRVWQYNREAQVSLISKDFLAGLTFMGLGLAGLVIARGYDMGTARTMGPGYFPWLLSAGLLFLGAVIFIQGIASKAREPIEDMQWRPVVLVTAAIFLFGMLIERAGLIVSLAILIALGSYAGKEARWKEVAILGAGLIVFCTAVFVYGVKLPLSVLPG